MMGRQKTKAVKSVKSPTIKGRSANIDKQAETSPGNFTAGAAKSGNEEDKKISEISDFDFYKDRHNIGRRQAAERIGSYKDSETAISFQGYNWPTSAKVSRQPSVTPVPVTPLLSRQQNPSATILNSSPLSTSSSKTLSSPDSVTGGKDVLLEDNLQKSDMLQVRSGKSVTTNKRDNKSESTSKTGSRSTDASLTLTANKKSSAAKGRRECNVPDMSVLEPLEGCSKVKSIATKKTGVKRKSADELLIDCSINKQTASKERNGASFIPQAAASISPGKKGRVVIASTSQVPERRMKREACLNAGAFVSMMYQNEERPAKRMKKGILYESDDDGDDDVTSSSGLSSDTTLSQLSEFKSGHLNIRRKKFTKSPSGSATPVAYQPAADVCAAGKEYVMASVIQTPIQQSPNKTKRKSAESSKQKVKELTPPGTANDSKSIVVEKVKKPPRRDPVVPEEKKGQELVFATLPKRMASLNAQAILVASQEDWGMEKTTTAKCERRSTENVQTTRRTSNSDSVKAADTKASEILMTAVETASTKPLFSPPERAVKKSPLQKKSRIGRTTTVKTPTSVPETTSEPTLLSCSSDMSARQPNIPSRGSAAVSAAENSVVPKIDKTISVTDMTTGTAAASTTSVSTPVVGVDFISSPHDSRVQFAGSVQMSSPTPNKQLVEMKTVTSSLTSSSRAFHLAPTRLYTPEPIVTATTQVGDMQWPGRQYSTTDPVRHATSTAPSEQRAGEVSVAEFHRQQRHQKSMRAGAGSSGERKQTAAAQQTHQPSTTPSSTSGSSSSHVAAPICFSAHVVRQNVSHDNSASQQSLQQHHGSFYTPLPAHHSYPLSPPPSHHSTSGTQQASAASGYPAYMPQCNPYSYAAAMGGTGYLPAAHLSTYNQAQSRSIDFAGAYKNMSPRSVALYGQAAPAHQFNDLQQQLYHQSQMQMIPGMFRYTDSRGPQPFVPPAHEAFAQSFAVAAAAAAAQSISPYSQFVTPHAPSTVTSNVHSTATADQVGGDRSFSPRSKPSPPSSSSSVPGRPSRHDVRPDLTDISYSKPTSSSQFRQMQPSPKPAGMQTEMVTSGSSVAPVTELKTMSTQSSVKSGRTSKDCQVQVRSRGSSGVQSNRANVSTATDNRPIQQTKKSGNVSGQAAIMVPVVQQHPNETASKEQSSTGSDLGVDVRRGMTAGGMENLFDKTSSVGSNRGTIAGTGQVTDSNAIPTSITTAIIGAPASVMSGTLIGASAANSAANQLSSKGQQQTSITDCSGAGPKRHIPLPTMQAVNQHKGKAALTDQQHFTTIPAPSKTVCSTGSLSTVQPPSALHEGMPMIEAQRGRGHADNRVEAVDLLTVKSVAGTVGSIEPKSLAKRGKKSSQTIIPSTVGQISAGQYDMGQCAPIVTMLPGQLLAETYQDKELDLSSRKRPICAVSGHGSNTSVGVVGVTQSLSKDTGISLPTTPGLKLSAATQALIDMPKKKKARKSNVQLPDVLMSTHPSVHGIERPQQSIAPEQQPVVLSHELPTPRPPAQSNVSSSSGGSCLQPLVWPGIASPACPQSSMTMQFPHLTATESGNLPNVSNFLPLKMPSIRASLVPPSAGDVTTSSSQSTSTAPANGDRKKKRQKAKEVVQSAEDASTLTRKPNDLPVLAVTASESTVLSKSSSVLSYAASSTPTTLTSMSVVTHDTKTLVSKHDHSISVESNSVNQLKILDACKLVEAGDLASKAFESNEAAKLVETGTGTPHEFAISSDKAIELTSAVIACNTADNASSNDEISEHIIGKKKCSVDANKNIGDYGVKTLLESNAVTTPIGNSSIVVTDSITTVPDLNLASSSIQENVIEQGVVLDIDSSQFSQPRSLPKNIVLVQTDDKKLLMESTQLTAVTTCERPQQSRYYEEKLQDTDDTDDTAEKACSSRNTDDTAELASSLRNKNTPSDSASNSTESKLESTLSSQSSTEAHAVNVSFAGTELCLPSTSAELVDIPIASNIGLPDDGDAVDSGNRKHISSDTNADSASDSAETSSLDLSDDEIECSLLPRNCRSDTSDDVNMPESMKRLCAEVHRPGGAVGRTCQRNKNGKEETDSIQAGGGGQDKWKWLGVPEMKAINCQVEGPMKEMMTYPAICHADGDVIRVRDCVLVKSGMSKKDIPYVAKIYGFWENNTGEMLMGVFWYYRLEHTETEPFPRYTRSEVFASRHQDIIPVACIEDRCYVLTLNEFNRYQANLKRQIVSNTGHCVKMSPVPKLSGLSASVSRLPSTDGDINATVFVCRYIYDYKLKRILRNPQIKVNRRNSESRDTANMTEQITCDNDIVSQRSGDNGVASNASIETCITSQEVNCGVEVTLEVSSDIRMKSQVMGTSTVVARVISETTLSQVIGGEVILQPGCISDVSADSEKVAPARGVTSFVSPSLT